MNITSFSFLAQRHGCWLRLPPLMAKTKRKVASFPGSCMAWRPTVRLGPLPVPGKQKGKVNRQIE